MNMAFTAIFNKDSKYFHKEGVVHYNSMTLVTKQAYCNDLLRVRGHLFLNEVHDILDIPRTREGQFAGWIKSGLDRRGSRAQFDIVNFGLDKLTTEGVLLTFNCRADILGIVFGKTP